METGSADVAPRFEILGPVRAWRADQEIVLGPGKQRSVLATLLLLANHPVSVPRIIDSVWGDDPPVNGPNVVQKHVSGLRRELTPGHSPRQPEQLLVRTDGGYLLRVAPGHLDLDVFHARLAESRALRQAGRLAEAGRTLRDGLALWHSPELAGMSGAFFDTERGRLAESRANAHEEVIEIELAFGRPDRLVPELLRLIAEFPLRERLRGLLMLALYRSGRQAEALDAFQQTRRFLRDELGIDPGEPLRRLHHDILTGADAGPTAAVAVAVASAGATGAGRVAASLAAAPPPGSTATAPMPTSSTATKPAAARLPSPVRQVNTVPSDAVPTIGAAYGAGARRPPMLVRVATLAGMVLLPLLSFGLATWAAMAYAAARLRSWPLAGAAVAYLGLTVGVLVLAGTPESAAANEGKLLLGALLTQLGGAVHGQLLRARLHESRLLLTDPAVARALHQRSLRNRAVRIVRDDPRLALELRIGRPDLPRQFDDGGLVDVNGVPERVLAALPGISAEQARQIVAVRARVGGFGTPDELAAHELVSPETLKPLRDALVALP